MWPFGVSLRGEASNHRMLRWLKTVVVSDAEKAPGEVSGGDREGERKRTAVDVSKHPRWHRNRGGQESPGWAWRVPEYWPGGARHAGGASLVCGSCTERGKAGADMPGRVAGADGERERADRQNPGGVEYRRGIGWRTGS